MKTGSSSAVRAVMVVFSAAVVAVAVFVGVMASRAHADGNASRPAHQNTKAQREAEMITHGAYYAWLAATECGTGDHARCTAALDAGRTALAPWGLVVLEDGSVSPEELTR